MKTQKRIICVMLLLSLMLSLFLPLMVSAEESYTLSGTWFFNEDIDFSDSSTNAYVNFISAELSSCYDLEFLSSYKQIHYMDDELGNVLVYDGSNWISDDYRYVDFGSTPQEVSREFYTQFTSVAKKVTVAPSNVIDDLSKDENFDVNAYPHNSTDYSLNVIQIAEGEGGELFIYVYQPSDATKDYEAKYINMSLQDISTRDLTYNLYSLTLVNSYGVFDKYQVDNFTVSDDSDRFYNIAGIYRPYDSDVDTSSSSEAIDGVNYKSFSVGQSWYTYYYNGELFYEMETMDVVEIDVFATGSLRYSNGFILYDNACDSHYIAFSVGNYDVEKIYDADITYKLTKYNYWYNNLGATSTNVLGTETVTKKLSEFDTGSNAGNGLLGKKYTWNRIQDVETFKTEAEADANETFNEVELAGLEQSEFVFRFAETDFTATSTGTEYLSEYSVASEIGILRLHFLSEGQYYNLGVVSDLVATDSTPELDTSNKDNIINYIEEMDEYLGDFLTFLMLIILVAIILVALVYLKPLASAIGKGFKEIISLIWSAVTLPFQLIGSLFSSKRR